MAIQIEAVLDHATVVDLLAQLTPLRVDLGDLSDRDRWIEVNPPDDVAFVAGKGIRIRTTARLSWSVAGIQVPFEIRELRILLAPTLGHSEAGGRLNLRPTLEEAELKHVPAVIEHGLIARVNDRLAAEPDKLGWDFAKTLAVRLFLPPAMAPLSGFEMDARDARLVVEPDALRIQVSLPMKFTRSPAVAPA
jgi:hypothetical protein